MAGIRDGDRGDEKNPRPGADRAPPDTSAPGLSSKITAGWDFADR
ncbi:hypothetical protein [Streptomyces sp. NPDC005907]